MKIEKIISKKEILDGQFKNIKWLEDSGLSFDELDRKRVELRNSLEGESVGVIKSKIFELVLKEGQIAFDEGDIFCDKLNAYGIMGRQKNEWEQEYYNGEGSEDRQIINNAKKVGAFYASADFGHVSVNTERLLKIGISGLMEYLKQAERGHKELSREQRDFYNSAKITLKAFSDVILRFEATAENPYMKKYLKNIALNAPNNIYEAMQLIIMHFFMHEYVAGARVRTLGRLDKMLYPFYENDIKNGTFTKEEIKELLKYFLNKFWSAKVPFDLPFELGGIDSDGYEVTNELSYLIVESYMELDIYSPKIHIRISDSTPIDFIKLVLSSIRDGKSSFVFGNDNVVIKALKKVGIRECDARDYTFIGCYEPAVYAHEIGCTGNGKINGAKMLEFVINRGRDLKTGEMIGVDTGEINSYEEFIEALKIQIKYAIDTCINVICRVEKHYMEIYPDLFLSAMLEECADSGVDAYAGGARYNNSSLYFVYIASLVDSVAAVKRLVFEDKDVTFNELCEILKNDWQGHEKLRVKALRLKEKYGNNNPVADEIMVDISKYAASLITGRTNGRGGVFKASSFSIDTYVNHGALTMATPDGRHAGEVLSKNLSPTTGMDKNGITALIESVTKMDFTDYPNGTVLDIILHPTAVSGEDGLDAMYAVLKTFFDRGGIAMHGNVFNAETLKDAQKNPEKYKTLQVRVCGWNTYFVNLSKEEQDDFIKKAENL